MRTGRERRVKKSDEDGRFKHFHLIWFPFLGALLNATGNIYLKWGWEELIKKKGLGLLLDGWY